MIYANYDLRLDDAVASPAGLHRPQQRQFSVEKRERLHPHAENMRLQERLVEATGTRGGTFSAEAIRVPTLIAMR